MTRSGNDRSSDGPSRPQQAVMVASGLLVLALLAFVGWQILSAPPGDAAPTANVTKVTVQENDRIAATVSLHNPRATGFRVVTVEVDCTSPPTELTFEFVPGRATRRGTVTCPSNATDPTATVASWVEA